MSERCQNLTHVCNNQPAGASSDGGTGRSSGLPAANGEAWSAVAAIVVAWASVVVVAPAGDVAGVVLIAQDIARSSDPPAASIILVANQTDLVVVGDFSGADRRRVEGRGGSEQRGTECAQCDGRH